MGERSLMAIAILGMIIGVSGLGLGALTRMQIQSGDINGEKGEDGDDGSDGTNGIVVIVNETVISYVCSSELEINNALEAIGGGNGIITIIDNILLTSTIIIDGGGSYLIQGQGMGSVIHCGINYDAFSIINATFCSIQDLKIDVVDFYNNLYAAIKVDEVNGNPVFVEKVQIIGDMAHGNGITINSNNTWIRDCSISSVYRGIYQTNSEGYNHICDNTIYECNYNGIDIYGTNNYISGNILDRDSDYAIYCHSSFNSISDNVISNCMTGIRVSGDGNTVGNNMIETINTGAGIAIYGDYNTISGNHITDADIAGIYIAGNYNTVNGNGCFYCTGSGGYGIYISSSSNENTILGNTCYYNNDNYEDLGTNTYATANNFS